MELKITSPEIELTLDSGDGATNTILFWPKGYVVSGVRCKFWAVQVTDDGEFTIHKAVDRKGEAITIESKKFSVDSLFKKAGTFSYCDRSSSNFNGNIFQQSSSPEIWKYYRFDFDTKEILRDINLNHPGDASFIKYYSCFNNHLYYIIENADTSETLAYVNLKGLGVVSYVATPTWTMSVVADKTDICAGENFLYVITENVSDQELHVYSHSDTLPVSPDFTYADIYTSDSYNDYPAEIRESDDNEIYVRKNGTQLYRISEGEPELLTNLLSEDTSHFRLNTKGLVYCEGDDFTQASGTQDDFFNKWFTPFTGVNNTTKVDAVVDELCTTAGISSSDIDVSDLSAISTFGLKLDENYTNDQALKSLMLIHKFNYVLSSGKMKFFLNGLDSIETVDESRLGMGTSRNNNLLEIVIEQGREIPKKVVVQYTSALEQYTRNSQILEMQSVRNKQVEQIDLSHHSISSTIAKQVCDRVLGQWEIEKAKFTMTVTTYYFKLEPGDVITVSYLDDTYNFRITNEVFQYPGLVTYTGVQDEKELWTSDLAGVDDEIAPKDIASYLPDDTLITALDIPILSGNDNSTTEIPVYIGIQQAGSGTWPGAVVLKKNGTWTEEYNTSVEAKIGRAVTVLAAPVTTGIIDITNSVTVQLTDTLDTLSSITEAQLLQRRNLAAIGDELICFKTATATANPGEYILTTLHRGVNGSEQQVDSHEVNEVFVLLDDTLTVNTVGTSVGLLGKNASFGTYTQGWVYEEEDDLEKDSIDSLFGYSVRPLHPVYLAAVSSGSDIVLTFTRRTRFDYDVDMDSDQEIELNEESEAYEIYIWDGASKTRTIESTSESATYTSAQQIIDFGGAQSSVKFSVSQISDLVGAGIESLSVTITL